MTQKQILLKNGNVISLEEWQLENNYTPEQLGLFFSVTEHAFQNDFIISEILLNFLDTARAAINRPMILNSVYRPQTKQNELISQGATETKLSPHTLGLAADIDFKTKLETANAAKILEKTAINIGINIRLGFVKYLKRGQTFIHVDVAPEYFAKNKPLHKQAHAWQWEVKSRW